MAPSDFWMPMMLVRSRTETNIIFAIPNPPTRIENDPMTQPAIPMISKVAPIKLTIASGWFMAKFSSSLGFNPLLGAGVGLIGGLL